MFEKCSVCTAEQRVYWPDCTVSIFKTEAAFALLFGLVFYSGVTQKSNEIQRQGKGIERMRFHGGLDSQTGDRCR